MLTISVKSNIDQVIRNLQQTLPKVVERATLSALNKTAAGAKVQMQRAITDNYKVSAALVRQRLQVKPARKKGAYAFTATLSGNPDSGGGKRAMNLIHFAQSRLTRSERAAWLRQSATKSGQVRAPQIPFQIKRSGGRVYVKGAFIGNDGRTVFVREGKGRLPIKAVSTIGVPQMFNTKANVGKVQAWINSNFVRILEHEIAYFASKARAA